MRPTKGQRYRAVHDVTVRGIVTFGAPFSGHFEGVFPEGETCVVGMEPPHHARGVYLVPDAYARFELLFVSEHDRNSDVYDSYAMAVSFAELTQSFEALV